MPMSHLFILGMASRFSCSDIQQTFGAAAPAAATSTVAAVPAPATVVPAPAGVTLMPQPHPHVLNSAFVAPVPVVSFSQSPAPFAHFGAGLPVGLFPPVVAPGLVVPLQVAVPLPSPTGIIWMCAYVYVSMMWYPP